MLIAALSSVVIASSYDGDTCTTTTGERVRLACIDTPELVECELSQCLQSCSRLSEKSCSGQEGRNSTYHPRPLRTHRGRAIRWDDQRSASDDRQWSRPDLLAARPSMPLVVKQQRKMNLDAAHIQISIYSFRMTQVLFDSQPCHQRSSK